MPLFAGGALNARAAEARAKRSKALADLEAARRLAELSAKQAYTAVLSGLSQIRALDDAVKSGQHAVKGNQVGYGLGVRINSDVLNAQQQYFSSLQDHERARYDTLFEGLKLKAATGELSPEDLRSLRSLMGPALTEHPASGGGP